MGTNPFHNPAKWECNGSDSGPKTYIPAYNKSSYAYLNLNKIRCSLCGNIIETNKGNQSC